MSFNAAPVLGYLTASPHGFGFFASGSPGLSLLRLNASPESSRYAALFSPSIVLAVAGLIFCAYAWLFRYGKLDAPALPLQVQTHHLMLGLLFGIAASLTLWNPA